jgi:hypothetical protein
MASAAHAEGQLDLFAEIETAARRERAASAPGLFDLDQIGYFQRVARAEQWRAKFGDVRSIREAHAWVPCISQIFNDYKPTDRCLPTLLTADLRCDHYRLDCACLGDLLYRGACFGCRWEGPPRDRENRAVEDAHDHAWPGWRDLPIVPSPPEPGTSAKQRATTASWAAHVDDVYPADWLKTGGPIRTRRAPLGTRHVPHRTGFGGYDLCGAIEPEPIR